MIAIVDYGVGNLASVQKAFAAVGAEAVLARDPGLLAAADAIVLPGVGNFGHCSREFHRFGLAEPLRAARARGVPLLGICVGMQLLFAGSEEDAGARGLGFLPGTVVQMRSSAELRVPQIGWNALHLTGPHPWLAETRDGDHFYFVHSYVPVADANVLATVEYGGARCVVAGSEGILGVQFHPEKSGANGLRLLRAFVRATRLAAAA